MVRVLLQRWAQVVKLDVQQRQEGDAAERTDRVQVRVVKRPACHDFLIVNQSFAGATLGATGHQHLWEEEKNITTVL